MIKKTILFLLFTSTALAQTWAPVTQIYRKSSTGQINYNAIPAGFNTYTPTPIFTPTATPTANQTPVIPFAAPGSNMSNLYASSFYLLDPIGFGTKGLMNPNGFLAMADSSGNTALIMTTAGRIQLRSGINFNEVIFNADGSTYLNSISAPLTIDSGTILYLNPSNNGNLQSGATLDMGGKPVTNMGSAGGNSNNATTYGDVITVVDAHTQIGSVTFTNSLTPVVVNPSNVTSASVVMVTQKGNPAVIQTYSTTVGTAAVTIVGSTSGATTINYLTFTQ